MRRFLGGVLGGASQNGGVSQDGGANLNLKLTGGRNEPKFKTRLMSDVPKFHQILKAERRTEILLNFKG